MEVSWGVAEPVGQGGLFIGAGFVTNRSEELHSGFCGFGVACHNGADPPSVTGVDLEPLQWLQKPKKGLEFNNLASGLHLFGGWLHQK